ncbi:MAG: hypothetical protein AB7F20_08475 [Geoalkalibacter sp.]|uniref:hypothetical protein n=1 Tax=Geoalkalibacter sp. TaxID=3041440 RepID=UPI003D10100B
MRARFMYLLIAVSLVLPGGLTKAAGALSNDEMDAGSDLPYISVPKSGSGQESPLPPLIFRTKTSPPEPAAAVRRYRDLGVIVRDSSWLPVWNPVATSAWARRISQSLPFDSILVELPPGKLKRLEEDAALRRSLHGLILELADNGVATGLVINDPVLFLAPERGRILELITALEDLPFAVVLLEIDRVLTPPGQEDLPLIDALVNLSVGVTVRSPWPVGMVLRPYQLDLGELGGRLEESAIDFIALRLEDLSRDSVRGIEPFLAIYPRAQFRVIPSLNAGIQKNGGDIEKTGYLLERLESWQRHLQVYPNFGGILLDDLEAFGNLHP